MFHVHPHTPKKARDFYKITIIHTRPFVCSAITAKLHGPSDVNSSEICPPPYRSSLAEIRTWTGGANVPQNLRLTISSQTKIQQSLRKRIFCIRHKNPSKEVVS